MKKNDISCIGIESKLGIHASPTCTMSFGENDGAIGYLVGPENQGLACMFAMMNEARLAVGLQGVAVSERAYQQAVAFSKDRIQGNVPGNKNAPIIEHPDVRRMLMTMRGLIQGGRALTYSAYMHIDHKEKLDEEEKVSYHQRRIDLLTPIIKGWCTENSIEVTSLGVQVHGGMGFIEETGAAQHLRDARILPIYEGTSGIQALDLVGRKLMKDQGRSITELLAELNEVAQEAKKYNFEDIAINIEIALKACKEATALLLKTGKKDWFTLPAASFNMLMLLGGTVAGTMLAKSAVAADAIIKQNPDVSVFYKNKISTAIFFAEHILPRNIGYLRAIKYGSKSIMAINAKDF